jgi:hypothetical protein
MWKEAEMKILSQNQLGRTEENYKNVRTACVAVMI